MTSGASDTARFSGVDVPENDQREVGVHVIAIASLVAIAVIDAERSEHGENAWRNLRYWSSSSLSLSPSPSSLSLLLLLSLSTADSIVVFGVTIKKEWLDLCGGERVYVFMFPQHNIYNGGATLYIFMSLCWKNIK